MRTRRRLGIVALLAAVASSGPACVAADDGVVSSEQSVRSLTKEEALQELDQIEIAIASLYGPLTFKKERFGFDLANEVAKAREATRLGSTEGDYVRAVQRLLHGLHDGHVGYTFPLRGDASTNYKLPLLFTPIEDRFVVATIGPELGTSTELARGDELVSFDGTKPSELFASLTGFDSRGTPESARHAIAQRFTTRSFVLPRELLPTRPKADLVLRNGAGKEYSVSIFWRKDHGGVEGQSAPAATMTAHALDRSFYSGETASLVTELSIDERGKSRPFFLTDAVRKKFGWREVAPSKATLAALAVKVPETDASAKDDDRFIWMRAYQYAFEGKRLLFVRFPSYSPPKSNYADNVKWFAGLLKEAQATEPAAGGAEPTAVTPADVLVIDDTHNPGGALSLVTGLASVLTDKPIGSFVQENRADRRWIKLFLDFASSASSDEDRLEWTARAGAVEKAFDAHQLLAPPLALAAVAGTKDETGQPVLRPSSITQWTRPVLVLTDELSASGGDFFPAIVQRNGIGKTFGARTTGAGGSVEEVLTLPHSQAKLRLTRGLAYVHREGQKVPSSELIENNGVAPDFPHAITLADFRAGFTGYVEAFSNVASALRR
jgi:hypothetical protein